MMSRKAARPATSATVETSTDLSAPALASKVLDVLGTAGNGFSFRRMGHDEPSDLTFDPRAAIALWTKNLRAAEEGRSSGQLILERMRSPHAHFVVHWQREPKGLWLNWMSLGIDEGALAVGAAIERFIGTWISVFQLANAGYGVAHHSAEWDEKGWRTDTLPDGRVEERSISLKRQEGLVDLYWDVKSHFNTDTAICPTTDSVKGDAQGRSQDPRGFDGFPPPVQRPPSIDGNCCGQGKV